MRSDGGHGSTGHPRPLLRRQRWWPLDGTWEFSLDSVAEAPGDVAFDRHIVVPFAPETEASGIRHPEYIRQCWYRRRFDPPAGDRLDDRLVLRFGAVDFESTVWLDGVLIGRHEGGYSPFEFDITDAVTDAVSDAVTDAVTVGDGEAGSGSGGTHELVVCARDDPLDLSKPRGKQDWEPVPHSIWYERTTGIWQSVWLERRPRNHLAELQWHADLHHAEVFVEVVLAGPSPTDHRLRVVLDVAGRMLVDDVIRVPDARFRRGFRLDGTGVDRLGDALFWTPEHPVLIDARLELIDADGDVVDLVHSYTAMRSVEVRDGRFLLNGRPRNLRLVLDQGYWPDTGLTPPDDEALRRDVELAQSFGFNGVRKHQKIEDPRFLYWADRMGLMVWYECPPAYRFDSSAIRRLTAEWTAAIERDRSHPCVIAWVPFNESTGVLDLPSSPPQQAFVRGLSLLTSAIDPTRPVVSNDGWETVGGDVIGVHDYEQDPERLRRRWGGDLRTAVLGYGTHGRLQTLDEVGPDAASPRWRPTRPIVLTEFGGIGWADGAPRDDGETRDVPHDRLDQPAAWGYSTVSGPEELAERYRALAEAVHSIDAFAGFCYTQLVDTYQEVNGLADAHRRPKVDPAVIAAATRGEQPTFHDPMQR